MEKVGADSKKFERKWLTALKYLGTTMAVLLVPGGLVVLGYVIYRKYGGRNVQVKED